MNEIILIVLITIIITAGVVYFIMKRKEAKKEEISEESQEILEKKHGTTDLLINIAEKNRHMVYKVPKMDGYGLGGNIKAYGLPRDIAYNDEGKPRIGNPNEVVSMLIMKGCLITSANPNRSPLTIHFSTPYRPDELDDNDPLSKIFKPYVLMNYTIQNTIKSIAESSKTQAEIMLKANDRKLQKTAFNQLMESSQSSFQSELQKQASTAEPKM